MGAELDVSEGGGAGTNVGASLCPIIVIFEPEEAPAEKLLNGETGLLVEGLL